jgi:hypothetical protein
MNNISEFLGANSRRSYIENIYIIIIELGNRLY